MIAEVDCSGSRWKSLVSRTQCLFRFQQGKQLGLVFQVRARRIAKRIPRAAILLMKQIAQARRIVAANAQFFAAFAYEKTRPALQRSPHSAHANKDTS